MTSVGWVYVSLIVLVALLYFVRKATQKTEGSAIWSPLILLTLFGIVPSIYLSDSVSEYLSLPPEIAVSGYITFAALWFFLVFTVWISARGKYQLKKGA